MKDLSRFKVPLEVAAMVMVLLAVLLSSGLDEPLCTLGVILCALGGVGTLILSKVVDR